MNLINFTNGVTINTDFHQKSSINPADNKDISHSQSPTKDVCETTKIKSQDYSKQLNITFSPDQFKNINITNNLKKNKRQDSLPFIT